MPTYCPCACHSDQTAAAARVEKMLDAAEGAGVDLWQLELHRRRLEHDMAEYDAVISEFGVIAFRADELMMSIESDVEVLAKGFLCVRATDEAARA